MKRTTYVGLPTALFLLPLSACELPPPAQEHVVACHNEVLRGDLHKMGDIIDVAEHRQVLVCMAGKGFGFQSSDSECIVSMAQADNPACYIKAK